MMFMRNDKIVSYCYSNNHIATYKIIKSICATPKLTNVKHLSFYKIVC